MSAGCPVLVSDRIDLASEIQSADAGIVVPPTLEAFSKAMKETMSNAKLRMRLGENAHKLILQKFTWDKAANSLLAVYTDILQGDRESPAWVNSLETK